MLYAVAAAAVASLARAQPFVSLLEHVSEFTFKLTCKECANLHTDIEYGTTNTALNSKYHWWALYYRAGRR